jgi:hypothetical protein
MTAAVAPKPRTSLPLTSSAQPSKGKMAVGQASGKRTLVDVMDQDLAAKKKKSEESKTDYSMHSRFFGPSFSPPKKSANRHEPFDHESLPEAGPSRTQVDKENVPLDVEDDLDISMEVALEFAEPVDPVTQEDGYLSPSPECPRWETPELSSPVQPRNTRSRSQDDFGADPISSPSIPRKTYSRRPRSASPPASNGDRGLNMRLRETTDRTIVGPDLRDLFGDDMTSEIDSFEGDGEVDNASAPILPPPSPVTQEDAIQLKVDAELDVDSEINFEADSTEIDQTCAERNEAVASGWREKWALDTTMVS